MRRLARALAPALSAVLLVLANDPAQASGRHAPGLRTEKGARAVRPETTRPQRLNRFQTERLRSLAGSSFAATPDTLRVALFQVQFTDTLMGGQTGSDRAPRDSTWFANEMKHVEQYFRGASRGRLTLQWTVDGTLYTSARRMVYYGTDATEEERVVELVQEVLAASDATTDFSQVDHVFIVHAGAGQETDIGGDSPIQLWSSFYDLSDIRDALDDDASPGLATGDGVAIDNFSIVPSDASQDFATVGTLGVWAFEIGNRLGLLPMFDSTPNGAPDSQGVGNFCLMAYGLFNANGFVPAFPCEFNRVLAGWVDPLEVDATEDDTVVGLTDINTGVPSDTVCVRVPITESEYFLVANRTHDANFDSLFTFSDDDLDLIPENTESLDGAEFDFFLTDLSNPAKVYRNDPDYGFDVLRRHTGSGVYIWHVDERIIRDAIASGYLPDDFAARKGVDLEEADGVQDLDRPGVAALALGSHFDSYRLGVGNRTRLDRSSDPASHSNSGAETGITIEVLSSAALRMPVRVRRDVTYGEVWARWPSASPGQAPTVVDLDNNLSPEIVILSDNAGLFLLNMDGTERVDADLNPATIQPHIALPGVTWTGPPAFANLDGSNDQEIVAISTSGRVYAWKANGNELIDGDANPGTPGVLFVGQPAVAPPMLVDVNGGTPEVVLLERVGSLVQIRFVDATGAVVTPNAAAVSGSWPFSVAGFDAAPPALARVTDGQAVTTGIVSAVVDSVAGRVRVSWTPVSVSGTLSGTARAWTQSFAAPSGSKAAGYLPTAPACGDLDNDQDDEIVVTLPDGTVLVLDAASALSEAVSVATGKTRAANPSAAAIGDVDRDGTLEIALWDDEYQYLYKSNARPMLEWPRRLRAESDGEAPPVRSKRSDEAPLILDIAGDHGPDILFPLEDGTLAAFDFRGNALASFPRVGPAEQGGSPTVYVGPGNDSRLVALGSPGRLTGLDPIVDTLTVAAATSLSIQTLPRVPGAPFWTTARADLARSGRTAPTYAVKSSSSAFDPESFIIYPNPVQGDVVNARITTHASARVRVSILTLEGQEALVASFDVNPGNNVNIPFDEALDVKNLKSGIYMLRIDVQSSAGGGATVKPFAIRR